MSCWQDGPRYFGALSQRHIALPFRHPSRIQTIPVNLKSFSYTTHLEIIYHIIIMVYCTRQITIVGGQYT